LTILIGPVGTVKHRNSETAFHFSTVAEQGDTEENTEEQEYWRDFRTLTMDYIHIAHLLIPEEMQKKINKQNRQYKKCRKKI